MYSGIPIFQTSSGNRKFGLKNRGKNNSVLLGKASQSWFELLGCSRNGGFEKSGFYCILTANVVLENLF